MMPIVGRLFICEDVDCGFTSEKGGADVVQHAMHTRHRVSSPPDEEGVYVTISVDFEEEPAKEIVVGDGFPNYCNTCGCEGGRHSYHCHNDR